jgi:Ca-activated chloride channel family protein
MKHFTQNTNQNWTFKRISLIIILFVFCIPFSFSQDMNEDKTGSPYFVVLSDNPNEEQLPLLKTSADVNITGVIADVTVNQVYKNNGNTPIEAIYTFPASSNAAVYAMEMTVGNRKIVAKIEEKNKARADYEKAKSEGKRTSLLTQERPNVFQMNVANIMPGDMITVSLKYTELIVPEKNVYKFVYPTVVGPRYTEGGSSDDYTSTPYQKQGKAPLYDFDIDINLSVGMPIQNVLCKTHQVDINYPNTSQAVIALNSKEKKGGNKDFVLEYQLSGDQIQSGLMLYEHDDENFFLLMVQPPKEVTKTKIPPREYIFIVDVSGSMRGFPISVTKKLLRNLVVNLRPTDKFNILVFAGASGWMGEESVFANAANVDKAIHFIDNQQGGGSTRLLPAMQKALSFPRHEESLSRSFIVVTDGYISVEEEVFELIRNNLDNANMFAFGIGSGVNRHLIEGMAHVGQGEPLIVFNEQEANMEAEKFRQYINKPVLTQIKKSFSGFSAYDVEPITIPDVLAERPVIIFGKYKGDANGSIKIKGYSGRHAYKKTVNVSEFKPDDKNAAIRYLWARKRIQMLDDYNNLSYNDERVKEVTNLGLKYNLMTAYTSFIAIDEQVVNDEGELTSVKQSLPLPDGVSDYAVGFELEVDDTELSYSFHRSINMDSDFPLATEKYVVTDLNNILLLELNECFENYLFDIDIIEVKLDAKGNVSSVNIEGNMVGNDIKQCISDAIKSYNFEKYALNKAWEFQIKF